MAREERKAVHFAPVVRTHSKQGPSIEPLAGGWSSQPAVTTQSSRRTTDATPSRAHTSHHASAGGSGGTTRTQAPGEDRYIHPLLMGGLRGVDLRRNLVLETYGDHGRLREAAFPETWNKEVQLRLSLHGTTVSSWPVKSKDKQPLSVLDVLSSIQTALEAPTAIHPADPLASTVAAACARRGGRTPRVMDLYGPADKLVLMRLVGRKDTRGSLYYDVDLLPWSHSRA